MTELPGGWVDGGRVAVVAPQSGRAVRARRGELVAVVDVEGHQVADMWVIDAADLRDVVVIVTSCAVDYPPLNAGRCTPLRIEITPWSS